MNVPVPQATKGRELQCTLDPCLYPNTTLTLYSRLFSLITSVSCSSTYHSQPNKYTGNITFFFKFYTLFCQQCRTRSAGFIQLIWFYTVFSSTWWIIFPYLKIASAFVVCCKFLLTFFNKVKYRDKQCGSGSDCSYAPIGADWSGSTLFVGKASKIFQQTTKADDFCCDWLFKGLLFSHQSQLLSSALSWVAYVAHNMDPNQTKRAAWGGVTWG